MSESREMRREVLRSLRAFRQSSRLEESVCVAAICMSSLGVRARSWFFLSIILLMDQSLLFYNGRRCAAWCDNYYVH
jgi:hypothetical protein